MSPRAAWRLETLGFEHVADYVAGKADWLAHGLPREGTNAAVPTAGDLADSDPPTCEPHDDLTAAAASVARSPYGFCLARTLAERHLEA
jgi:3-mercaptopyruvate sulfurtransferase SseA